jgi:hypothetical protein
MSVLEREKYTGDLRNGIPHGQGICEFANGDKYIGEFRNGECEGFGILTFGSGKTAPRESRSAASEFEKWMAGIFVEN